MKQAEHRILVIGGAGFIGKSLIRKLLSDNIFVLAMDIVDKPEDLPFEDERFQWVTKSYVNIDNDAENFIKVIEKNKINTAIHLATTLFPNQSRNQIEKDCYENVYSSVCLFNKLFEHGCDKIIYASSSGTIYGDSDCNNDNITFNEDDALKPNVSYGLTKEICERYLSFLSSKYNKVGISLRLSNPYGEGQNLSGTQGVIPIFMNKISKGEQLDIWGDVNSSRDYIYIDDIVDSFIHAIHYDGPTDVFNIAAGKSISLKKIIELLENNLDMKSHYVVTNDTYDKPKNISLCIEKARKMLNWEPKYTLNEGLEKIIKFHGLKNK